MMITMCAFKGRIFGHGIIVFVARVRERVWGQRGRSTRSGSVYMRVYWTVFEIFFFLFLLAFFFMAMFFFVPHLPSRLGKHRIGWEKEYHYTWKRYHLLERHGKGAIFFDLHLFFPYQEKWLDHSQSQTGQWESPLNQRPREWTRCYRALH